MLRRRTYSKDSNQCLEREERRDGMRERRIPLPELEHDDPLGGHSLDPSQTERTE